MTCCASPCSVLFVPDGSQTRRSGRSALRQVDRGLASSDSRGQTAALLALSLRVRRAKVCRYKAPSRRGIDFLWLLESRYRKGARDQTRHVAYAAAQFVERDAVPLPECGWREVSRLWWSWHPDNSGVGCLREFPARHGTNVGAGNDPRTHRRERQLRTSKLHLGPTLRAAKEPTPVFGVEAS